MTTEYHVLEKTIGIVFSDRKLLENIFVHRSYLNEHKSFYLPSNEKLEFLGDSVLSLISAMYLYQHYPKLHEGEYTDIKAAIVRTESLAQSGSQLHLGNYLLLSHGEESGNGRENMNILADCFEALIAGIFIDKGFQAAYDFVLKFLFTDRLNYIVEHGLYLSPKSRLQEKMQSTYKKLPTYTVIEEKGPEHLKEFTVTVSIDNTILGTGHGSSKKQAEEQAAKQALEIKK